MKRSRKDSVVSSPNGRLHFVVGDNGQTHRCFQTREEAEHLDTALTMMKNPQGPKPPEKDEKR